MKIISKFKRSANIFVALTSLIFTVMGTQNVLAQECVSCDSTTTGGLFPSAIGRYTTATGHYSFAGGIYSAAEGSASFAFGNRVKVNGGSSIGIGRFINITASSAMVIGLGFDIDNTLVNNVPHSFMIGIGSTKPTFFVGESIGVNSTGKIGIGNVTDPQAKLHILSDENEAATLKLEHQTTGTKRYAEIELGTHHIRAGNTENMVFSTPDTSRHFVFENGNVGIGLAEPEAKLHVQGNFKLGSDIGDVGENSFAGGEGSSASGTNSFAFGKNTKATGTDAVAIGFWSEATSDKSFALGFYNHSNTAFSYLFGQWLKSTISSNITIGFGAGQSPLINNKHRSLMMGMNSDVPSFFISSSDGAGTTGKIGIGNMTDPQAKLHILSDTDEAATLKLEHQTTGIKRYAEIDLGTHHIRAGNTENMVFSTPDTNRHFVFENGNVGIGLAEPEAKLHVQGNFKLGSDIGDVGENSFAGGEGSSASGKYSFAFGRYAKATHLNSVAIGFKAEATSEMAVAIGYINKATAESTYLFGERLMAGSSGAFVIGRGASSENSLQNNVNSSLMIGFNSTVPTFFVSQSSGAGTTGKIGIGNITNPQAKLHIKADDNEDASLKLETSGEEQYSRLQFSENHEIKTRPEDNFHFSTQAETDFVFHQGNIFIEDIQKGVIMRSPDGQCWLGKVNNQGMLAFEQTTCPEEQTSQSETMAPASQLKVYPNPATGYVEVHTGTISGKLALSLMDANGKQLREQQAQSGKNILNLDGLPSGAYILVLKQDGKLIESEKIVVK